MFVDISNHYLGMMHAICQSMIYGVVQNRL